MGAINWYVGSITGTTGSTNSLEPKASWRVYVCPRGMHVKTAGSASPIVVDSAAAASRIAANQWFQVGTDVTKVRQCAAVGGNSFSYSGAAISVAVDDRIIVIGNTQPTVAGGSASYQPHTTIYAHDDDSATPATNSMVTSDTNGTYQFGAADGTRDLIVQDSNQAIQGIVIDAQIGLAPGDLIPDTPYTRLIGNTASPWGSVYYAGELISGVTGAAGVTYHSHDTTAGWTQGNLFGYAINNATKVYGDTHGGVHQSWTLPTCFNVRSAKYGAKGDNSTDDTTAIQTALNDAAASISGTSGGTVFLPRGTYIVNSTLTVPTKVRLMGEGRSATTIKAGGSFVFNGSTDAVIRQGSATENAHGTWIEDLNIDCNSVANSIGVYSTRLNEPGGIRRCSISRAILYGIYYSTLNCQNWSIRDVEIYMSDSAGATSKGIYIDLCAGAMIVDRITINNYSGSGTNIGVGIHLAHTGGHIPTVSNSHLEACTVGIRQSSNDAHIFSITGNATTTVLVVKDGSAVNAVLGSIYTGGSPTGLSDSVTGFTSDSVLHYIESGGGSTVISTVSGHTWTLPQPMVHSGYVKNSGTFTGSNLATLTCGTALTLPAGNLFGLSSAPAGATTVTSFVTVNNGRRVSFLGQAGVVTINNGNNIHNSAAGNITMNPGDYVEYQCIGTTWYQCQVKVAV